MTTSAASLLGGPSGSMGITPLRRYYEAVPPLWRIGTFSLTVGAACACMDPPTLAAVPA
jgi:hypothetical protein